MKQILLIGGAGYVGSVIAEDLLKKELKVTVIDNFLYKNDDCLKYLGKYRFFKFINGDLANLEKNQISLNKDTDVIILGGLVGDPITKKYPKLNNIINIEGVKKCIDYFDNKKIGKLIFISTCSNYGLISKNVTADEKFQLRPLSLYAKAKVEIENYILEKKKIKTGYEPVILRFATAFGLSHRMRFDLTVNEFTFDLLNKKVLEVYDPETWRPYCHVKDFSRIILLVLNEKKKNLNFEIFNCGSDENNFRKKDIVNLIKKKISNTKVVFKSGDVDPRNYRVNFSKIQNVLNFKSKYSVSYGIDEIINNFQLFKDKDKKFFGNYEI